MPPLALDQPCEPPEVFQFRRFQTARAISKNVRRLLAARSRPGRTTPADLLDENALQGGVGRFWRSPGQSGNGGTGILPAVHTVGPARAMALRPGTGGSTG